MSNEKLIELREVLKKDIRFLDKFELQTTNLKLHEVSGYTYNKENGESNFEWFCRESYDCDFFQFLINNDIDDSNWFTCGSTIIPFNKDLLTYCNTKRGYILELDYRDNDYTNEIDTYIDVIHTGKEYNALSSEGLTVIVSDINELMKDKLFYSEEDKDKLIILTDIYNSIGGIREELKDQLFEYYKVLRFINNFKRNQIEIYKEWLESKK